MRLSEVLNNQISNEFVQVEKFLGERRLKTGKQLEVEIGVVFKNLFCGSCKKHLSFSSPSRMYCLVVGERVFSISSVLRCPNDECKVVIPSWFLVEFEGDPYLPAPKARLLKRSIGLQELVRGTEVFSECFENADYAYENGFGAGSVVYLRKILERVTIQVAVSLGVETTTSKNYKKPFRGLLEETNAQFHSAYHQSMIPQEFAADGYRLFGELSEIVHGDFDEQLALQKYPALRRLVVGIVDNVNNNREIMEAIGTLGWVNEE